MNWFRQNPFWSAFIGLAGGALLLSLGLLWRTKGSYDEAVAQYRDAASAKATLENGNPYPSAANVTKMKMYLDDYKGALDKLKAELKAHMLPEVPLAPNEFQTHLRQAISQTMENARSHRVKLPANFFLGFDEFVSSLPSSEETPALGQELSQIQLLLNTIIEARVDGITAFHRIPHSGITAAATPTTTPRASPKQSAKLLEQRTVEFTIAASPTAGRKVINQIAATNEQFFIIRAVQVKNQKDKGPARESPSATGAAVVNPLPAVAAGPTP